MENTNRNRLGLLPKLIMIGVAALILISALGPGFHAVPAGHRGMVLSFGKPINVVDQGLYVWAPWWTQNVQDITVQTQKFEDPHADAASKDLQTVQAKIAVNYHLDSSRVQEIYITLGTSWEDRIIRPNMQEVVKAVTSQYTAEELITHRPLVQQKIFDELVSRTAKYGIVVEAINIVDFQFSPDFTKAIEAKVTAEQNALQELNVLAKIRTIALEKNAEALGIANAQVTIANATARATIINAQANAEALRLIRAQITAALLQYNAINKWDGKLPTLLVTTQNGTPFIVDLNELLGQTTSTTTSITTTTTTTTTTMTSTTK